MYAKDFPSARSDRYRSIPRYVGLSHRAQRLLVPQVSEVFARDCSTFWNNNTGGLAVIPQDRDANGRLRVPFFVRLIQEFLHPFGFYNADKFKMYVVDLGVLTKADWDCESNGYAK